MIQMGKKVIKKYNLSEVEEKIKKTLNYAAKGSIFKVSIDPYYSEANLIYQILIYFDLNNKDVFDDQNIFKDQELVDYFLPFLKNASCCPKDVFTKLIFDEIEDNETNTMLSLISIDKFDPVKLISLAYEVDNRTAFEILHNAVENKLS